MTQTRELILSAARQLLLEGGQEAVTPTRLSQLTGISRSTIYRHWSHPSDITFEATGTDTEQPPFTPVGDPRTDLREYLTALREMLGSQQATLVATQIERAEHDEQVAGVLREISAKRRDLIRRLADGTDGTDGDFVAHHALLVGPLFFQRFLAREEISDELIDLVVAACCETR